MPTYVVYDNSGTYADASGGSGLVWDDTDGWLGIGKTPGVPLDVSGATDLAGLLTVTTSVQESATFKSGDANGGYVVLQDHNSSDAVRGFVGWGNTLLSGGAGSIAITDMAIRSQGGLAFGTNGGNTRVYVDSNGNLGVNTITPSHTLDVNGTGNFSGDLTATTGTFSGAINQTASNGANNQTPLFQFGDLLADTVASGLMPPVPSPSSAITTIPSGVAYVTGQRLVSAGDDGHTYGTAGTAQDTYVDLSNAGAFTYNAVTQGSPAPALTANSVRICKVTTNTTPVITAVTAYPSQESGYFPPTLAAPPSSSGSGKDLFVQAGRAQPGASNANGGTLVLQGGIATGDAVGSVKIMVSSGGSSGSQDSLPQLAATFDSSGATLNGKVDCQTLKVDNSRWITGPINSSVDNNFAVKTTDPTSPNPGDMWFVNTSGAIHLRFFDGSNTWGVALTKGG